MKRHVVLAVTLILALAVMLPGCGTGNETDSAVTISTQLVKKGDLQIGVYADGRISVPVTKVNFAASGIVSVIHVEPGQAVLAGDLLAELDAADSLDAIASAETNLQKAQMAYDDAVRTRAYTLETEKVKLHALYLKYIVHFDDDDYEQTVQAAEENVAAKEAALTLAEEALTAWLAQQDESTGEGETLSDEQKAYADANDELAAAKMELQTALDSLSVLFDRDDFAYTAAKEAYDLQYLKVENLIASTTSLVNAELNLDEAEKKLGDAKAGLEQTKLYAPVSGHVHEVSYAPGDAVQSRTSEASGTSDLITLYNPTDIQLVAYVNEGDVSGLETGQALRVTVDALYLENQAGTLTSVSLAPKIDNTGIVTYAVTGRLENPDERILDGMSVFVLFLKKEKTDVLLVPNRAVFMDEGRQHVHVQMPDGTIEKRPVVLGLTNGTLSEVVEGLVAGENVVTSGVDR